MVNGLVLKILGDDSGLQKTLSGIGTVAKKGLGVAIKATAAVGAGFVTATGAALKFSGELEQNLGGAEAVFGEFADTIEKKAEKAFKNMGLSTSDYLATANKMGSLFKGAGFEMKEAMDITTEAMQRAADVASIMGIDTAWAMESIAGAAKGNFTMMDNLGVAMNDTTLNAYALEQGLGKTTAQMTNQEKIGLAMKMFLEKTAYAAGNYAKENETLAGALGTAKAALENFMSGAGSVTELQDALKNASTVIVENLKVLAPQLAEGLIEVVRGLAPVIPDIIIELLPGILDTVQVLFEEALAMLPGLISQIASAIGEAIPGLKPITDLISVLADNIDTLTVAVSAGTATFVTYKAAVVALNVISTVKTLYAGLTGAITAADVAQKSLNASMLANPYALAAAAVVGLVAAIVSLAKAEKSAAAESMEAAEKLRDAYDEKIAAIEETEQAQQEEAVKVELLKNRLYDLETQIKSGTLTEAEAKIVQDNFNRSAQDLNDIIPGIVDNLYDETGAISIQKDEVEKLATSYVKLAQAKAQADALYDKMKAAWDTYYTAEEEHRKAYSDYITADTENTKFINGEAYDPDKIVPSYELNEMKTASEDWYRVKLQAKDDVEKWGAEWGKVQDTITALSAETANKVETGNNRVTGTVTSNSNRTAGTVASDSKKTTDAVVSDNQTVTKSVKTEADNQTKIYEQKLKEELDLLQFYHDNGLISDAEYYAQLTKYRDNYFAEGSEEWKNYTTEIAAYYASVLDDISEKQKQQIEELFAKRDSFADNMQSYDGLFTETTTTFLDKDGKEDLVVTNVKLTDFSEQTEQIKHFGDNLTKLKEKGNIPQELFSEISKLSREDGIKLTDKLLSMPEEDFQEWIESYSNMIGESNRVADALFEDEIVELKKKFILEWVEIPDDFFSIGLNSAEQFSAGFLEALQKKTAFVKVDVLSAFDGLTSNAQIVAEQQATSGGNTYNTTINMLDTPEETTREKIKAGTDWDTQQQMRGDY